MTMSRTPRSAAKSQLWTPNLGIRFSPPQEKVSLYPRLDMPRFLHTDDGVTDVGVGRRKTIQGNEVGSNGQTDSVEPTPRPSRPSPWTAKSSPAAPSTSATKTRLSDEPTPAHFAKGNGKPQKEPIDTKPWSDEPPSSPLSFNISHELFHAAKAATAGTPQSYWSHTLYRRIGDSGEEERVKVHYCKSKATMEYVCKKHFLGHDVLGFDLEWMAFANRQSSARENVSLIQLASPGRIGLFHVSLFSSRKDKSDDDDSFVAPTFRQIMEDSTVSKVGVQVLGDCTRLNNYLGVKTRGVFELSHLFKQVKYSAARTPSLINKRLVSLAVQVHECLGLPLFKGESVRSSNWMKGLSSEQLLYSAADAYAGLQLYHVLDAKREALDPCPPQPSHVELRQPIPIVLPDSDQESESEPEENLAIDAELEDEPAPAPAPPPTRARDDRVIAGEEKALRYRASKRGNVSASPAALRSYYIWHSNTDLEPADIAAILRDPPLKTNTVVSYILDAIVAEKMPYDKTRLKTEVLPLLAQSVAVGSRYGALVRSCQRNDEVNK